MFYEKENLPVLETVDHVYVDEEHKYAEEHIKKCITRGEKILSNAFSIIEAYVSLQKAAANCMFALQIAPSERPLGRQIANCKAVMALDVAIIVYNDLVCTYCHPLTLQLETLKARPIKVPADLPATDDEIREKLNELSTAIYAQLNNTKIWGEDIESVCIGTCSCIGIEVVV